jgi:hypothetical protein
LEDFSIRIDGMVSMISENQFIIHVLDNTPTEYNLQFALLEKRIGDKDKPFVEEMSTELSLSFE